MELRVTMNDWSYLVRNLSSQSSLANHIIGVCARVTKYVELCGLLSQNHLSHPNIQTGISFYDSEAVFVV